MTIAGDLFTILASIVVLQITSLIGIGWAIGLLLKAQDRHAKAVGDAEALIAAEEASALDAWPDVSAVSGWSDVIPSEEDEYLRGKLRPEERAS